MIIINSITKKLMNGPFSIGGLQSDLDLSHDEFNSTLFNCEHVKHGISNNGEYSLYLSSSYEIPESEISSSESFNILLEDKQPSKNKVQLTIDGEEIKT